MSGESGMGRESGQGYARLAEEYLLRAAALASEELLAEEMAAQPGADEAACPPKLAGRVERAVRARARRGRRVRRLLRGAAAFAAGVLLCSCVVYASDEARTTAVNYLISSFSQCSQVWYDDGNQPARPLGWRSDYYPHWLPGDYTFAEVAFSADTDEIWFKTRTGTQVYLGIITRVVSSPMSFNTEDMDSRQLQLDGYSAQLYWTKNGDRRLLLIFLPNAVIEINGEISEEDLLRIGGSFFDG